jgi:hypothetical protein
MKKYLLVLYLIILITCDDNIYQKDNDNCIVANPTKENCAKVNLLISENYCCLSYEESDKEMATCEYVDEEKYYTYTNSKCYALEKERIGFNCHNEMKGERGYTDCQSRENNQDYKKIYECKNGNANITNEIYIFSESEKEILNSENHCLAHMFEYIKDPKKTKKECSDALLTEQAKKEGITCALYEFAYTLRNRKNKMTRNSCYLLNPDSINNEAKAKREIKKFAMSLLFDDEEADFENFQVTISDNSNHSFSYDSTTDTLKNSDSNSNGNAANTNSDNNSRLISFSKYLFLLLLISL